MKHKISILGLLFLTASICLVVWTFFTLSRPGYRSIELPDTCAGSHGWGGYEIRTGPDTSIPVAPRYTDGYGYTLSDESYDAVRRSRIMAEEDLYLTEARLEMDYSGCGIELFLDGQLFYSDFQVSLRDSNGFLLLDGEGLVPRNEYRSIAVGLPMDFIGKTLTMTVYYPFADTWGAVPSPVVNSDIVVLAAGIGTSMTATLWQVLWGVMMILMAVGNMGPAPSRILRANYILLFFMYTVKFVMSAYESILGFYSGLSGRVDKLLAQKPLGMSWMGSAFLILCTLVLLSLELCGRGQKKRTLPAGWTLLFALVGFLITAMQNSSELGNGVWGYLDILRQCMGIGNWMPVVMAASSTIMYILTMRAIVQFVSQQVEKWRTRSRIVERSRFARENYEIIMQVDEDSRRRKHEMKHHMQTVYSLLKAREAEKAEEYIEKLVQETDQFAETAYSENIVINSIVGIRLNQAKKEGIAVRSHIHVPDRLEVDDVDLNNLLSNMLENAIEACMRMENRSRAYINLEIRKKQRFLFIECENSVDREEKLASGQATLKSDPAEHGFGLKTMNAVAEKYASIIQIEREPGWFVVRTNLCLPE